MGSITTPCYKIRTDQLATKGEIYLETSFLYFMFLIASMNKANLLIGRSILEIQDLKGRNTWKRVLFLVPLKEHSTQGQDILSL